MADDADGSGSGSSPDVGSEIESLRKEVSKLTSLVKTVVEQPRVGGVSSVSVAAPAGTGPEAGMHPVDRLFYCSVPVRKTRSG